MLYLTCTYRGISRYVCSRYFVGIFYLMKLLFVTLFGLIRYNLFSIKRNHFILPVTEGKIQLLLLPPIMVSQCDLNFSSQRIISFCIICWVTIIHNSQRTCFQDTNSNPSQHSLNLINESIDFYIKDINHFCTGLQRTPYAYYNIYF